MDSNQKPCRLPAGILYSVKIPYKIPPQIVRLSCNPVSITNRTKFATRTDCDIRTSLLCFYKGLFLCPPGLVPTRFINILGETGKKEGGKMPVLRRKQVLLLNFSQKSVKMFHGIYTRHIFTKSFHVTSSSHRLIIKKPIRRNGSTVLS